MRKGGRVEISQSLVRMVALSAGLSVAEARLSIVLAGWWLGAVPSQDTSGAGLPYVRGESQVNGSDMRADSSRQAGKPLAKYSWHTSRREKRREPSQICGGGLHGMRRGAQALAVASQRFHAGILLPAHDVEDGLV